MEINISFKVDFEGNNRQKPEYNSFIYIFREGIWYGKLGINVLLLEKSRDWIEKKKNFFFKNLGEDMQKFHYV